MSQTIFYPGLEEFSRKSLISNSPVSVQDALLYAKRFDEHKEALFEQLLLFDHVRFTVYGKNITLPLLIKMFGIKRFEELLEQGAISFVLWKPMVGFIRDTIPGLDGMVHGNVNSKPHSDPE